MVIIIILFFLHHNGVVKELCCILKKERIHGKVDTLLLELYPLSLCCIPNRGNQIEREFARLHKTLVPSWSEGKSILLTIYFKVMQLGNKWLTLSRGLT